MSMRMTTQSTTVLTGLSWKKKLVMADLPDMASQRLSTPKTPPSTPPATGPMIMAPMAIGSVRKLMLRGPMGTLPRPRSLITSSMAISSAICASVLVVNFFLLFIEISSLLPLPEGMLYNRVCQLIRLFCFIAAG